MLPPIVDLSSSSNAVAWFRTRLLVQNVGLRYVVCARAFGGPRFCVVLRPGRRVALLLTQYRIQVYQTLDVVLLVVMSALLYWASSISAMNVCATLKVCAREPTLNPAPVPTGARAKHAARAHSLQRKSHKPSAPLTRGKGTNGGRMCADCGAFRLHYYHDCLWRPLKSAVRLPG